MSTDASAEKVIYINVLEISYIKYIIIDHNYFLSFIFRSLFINSWKAEDIFLWIQSNTAAERMSSLYTRTRKQDNVASYFDYDKIFIVDNERNYHWTFFCIFMGSKTIAFYDSLNGKPKSGKSCDGLLKMLLELARIEQRKFDVTEWKCVQASCTEQVC